MKPGPSNLQSYIRLGTELLNKLNSPNLPDVRNNCGEGGKRKEEEWVGGEEEGGNKLNPVKLFFHSQ